MTKDSVQRVAAAIFSRLKGAFAPLDHNHPDATAADAGFMSSDDKKALSELYQPISSMAEADLGNYTYFGDWFYGNSTALVGTILRNCPGIYYETDVLPFRQDAIFLGEADDAAFQECFWLAIPHGDYDLLDGDYSHYSIYYARKGDTVPEFYMDADHGEFAQVSLQERFAAVMAGNTVRHSHWHDASDIASGTIPIDRLPVGTSDKNVAAGNHSHSQYASSTHSHSASSIISGKLAIARIPTGTTAQTVALGNHTHSQYAAAGHSHDIVTTTANGLMSSVDKFKLDSVIVDTLPSLSTSYGLGVLTDITTDPTGHIVVLGAESAGQLTLYPLHQSLGAYYVDDAGNYYNAGQVAGVWTFSQMSELHGIDSYPRLAAYRIADDVALPRIWTGTQAEYDALAAKSSTTLYFITE